MAVGLAVIILLSAVMMNTITAAAEGDGKLTYSVYPYLPDTKYGRNLVQQTFLDCGIDILTQAVPECIDHIAVSKGFAGETVTVTEWNKDKSLSDHKGIVVEIS